MNKRNQDYISNPGIEVRSISKLDLENFLFRLKPVFNLDVFDWLPGS